MKKYFNLLVLSLAVFSLSSCLKDNDITLDPNLSPAVVEFTNLSDIASPQGAVYPLYVTSFSITPTATFNLTLNYTGGEVAPTDVQVKVDLLSGVGTGTAIKAYNDEQHTSFVELPSSMHTFTSGTFTIPKGAHSVTVPVTVKPNLFSLTTSYALAFKISSTTSGGISQKFGTVLVAIGAKNNYDGVYSNSSGNIQRYSAPGVPTVGDALNGNIAANPDLTLITVDANTVSLTNLRWAGGTSTVAGIDGLQIVVDPTTNLVTMRAAGNASLANMPGRVNKYDPVTKTFTLNFAWNQTANAREVTDLIFKYKGSR